MFAAPEISPSMGHTSDTLKCILNHRGIRTIEEANSDISTFNFGSNVRTVNILASSNRDSGAVETYIPDTETAFDWLNYHS